MTPQQIDTIERLIRCAGSSMNWMEQVSRVKIPEKTKTLLQLDMAMCNLAIASARSMLAEEQRKPTPVKTSPSETYMPPADVCNAARLVSNWHKEQGCKEWALMDIQSRNH